MKQSIKKSILLFVAAFFAINAAFAQMKETPITEADVAVGVSAAGAAGVAATDAGVLSSHFTKQGFKAAGLNKAGSVKFEGRDAQGEFVVKIVTNTYKKGNSSVDVTEVSVTRGNKTESTSFAEDNAKSYSVANRVVKSSAAGAGASEVGISSLASCAAQFIGSSPACQSCKLAVQNCIAGKARWYARIICTVKCVGPCLGCIPSISRIIAFVKCAIG